MAVQFYAIDESKVAESILSVPVAPFNARINVGDRIVSFKRTTLDITFMGERKVKDVRDVDVVKADGSLSLKRDATLTDLSHFDSPRDLIPYAGSLQKVYRFLDPQRHFQRPVVKLSKRDFYTIVEGRTYIARSVFRLLFSSLPLVLQSEFVRINIEVFPFTADGRVERYTELAPLLLTFVSQRLVSPLVMLSQIATIHETTEGLPSISDLTLATIDGEKGDQIGNWISLGTTCADARRFLSANRLIVANVGYSELLDEGFNQLKDIEMEGEIKWSDPIF